MRRSAIDPDYAHLLAAGDAQHKEKEDGKEERVAVASDAQEEERKLKPSVTPLGVVWNEELIQHKDRDDYVAGG